MENFTVVQSTRLAKLKRLNVKWESICKEIIDSGSTLDLEYLRIKTLRKINKIIKEL